MNAIDKLKEDILENYPRLSIDDTFSFACHAGLACFSQCCGDVNILLTPYDVLRMKQRLGLRSGDFLDRYTILPFGPSQRLPLPILKMNEDDRKTCPFVDPEKGCTIYADRPWPCRMYPLGLASPGEASTEAGFYFLLKEPGCLGFESNKEWPVREWMESQGVATHDEIGRLWGEITLHPKIQQGKLAAPKQIEMIFMATYDLDKFRRFLFETKFFERFDVEVGLIDRLKDDDLALLKFGFRWLKFCIFGEKTLKIRQEVAKTKFAAPR